MLFLLCGLIFFTGLYPLWRAWRANRQTSLLHAVGWASSAYLAVGASLATAASGADNAVIAVRFVML